MTARATRYNPDRRQHSWNKLREHHKQCRFCGIHVENKQGRHAAEWFQEWTWLDGSTGSTEWSGTKSVPKCPGPDADKPTDDHDYSEWPLPAAEIEDAEHLGLMVREPEVYEVA